MLDPYLTTIPVPGAARLNPTTPGPLHFPALLIPYPFRYRDELSGKWVRARYVAERDEISARHKDWEIVGPGEVRGPQGRYFTPFASKLTVDAGVTLSCRSVA